MRVVRWQSLVAGGCRTNVCVIPFCFLSLSDRRARLLSAKPLELSRKHVLILLCFVSTLPLSRLQAPFVINVSQTFRQLLLPAEHFGVLHQSFQKLVFNHPPTISTFLEVFLKEKRKIFHSLVHSLRESCKMINWFPESRWSGEVNKRSAGMLWSAVVVIT